MATASTIHGGDHRAAAAAPAMPAPVIEPRVETVDDTEEPEVAHITRRDDSVRGYVEGTPIEALCGVRFVPSRNPEGMPVCEPCRQAMERILAGRSGMN